MGYAILTCALHEHAYINTFVSYYINLGFDVIYILCDQNQPSYDSYLFPTLKSYVRCIHMKYTLKPGETFDGIQMRYYQKVIRMIPHEWIFLCDIDEFLYLSSGNIKTYMNSINHKSVSQISFPWMIVDSLKPDAEYTHLFDILDNASWHTNRHVKSIFRKADFERITSTHYAHVKGLTRVGGREEKVAKPLYEDRFNVDFYKSDATFIIHFHTRSFENNIIKILTAQYSGKSDHNQRTKLISLVKAGNHDLSSLTKFALVKAHKHAPQITPFPLKERMKSLSVYPTNIGYNDALLDHLLQKYQLPKSYFTNPEVYQSYSDP